MFFNRKPKYDFKWLRTAGIVKSPQENFTPDFLWLERHEWRILFVYDEMMHGRKLYDLIKDESINLGKAFTDDDNFVLWKKKLGEETFPIAVQGCPLGKQRRIKGEIHAIRPHLFWNVLDKRMLNGIEFRRERVKVLVPYHYISDENKGQTIDHNEFIHRLSTFMYVGNRTYWEPQFDGGYSYSTVKAFNPKVKWVDGHTMNEYYYYSRLEDETNF